MMKLFRNILLAFVLANGAFIFTPGTGGNGIVVSAIAQNTSPQAILFTREKVRPASERILQAGDFCDLVVDEWTATSMSDNFPTGLDVIRDGCNTTGRNCLTNNDVLNLITACMAIQNFVNGGAVTNLNRLNVLVKPAVNRTNPTPVR